MSKVTLQFDEYQDIRQALAMAEGYIKALAGDNDPLDVWVAELVLARKVLNAARWRTEEQWIAARDRSIRWRARQAFQWVRVHRPTW